MFWLGIAVGLFVGFLGAWLVAAIITTAAAWSQIRETEHLGE
jgi:ABC-type antimicrobial peptide transport system permease subunit